jgi:hypothetical protein
MNGQLLTCSFLLADNLLRLFFRIFQQRTTFLFLHAVTSTDNFKRFCLRHHPSKVNLNRHFRYDHRITFDTNVPTSAARDNNTSSKCATAVNNAGGSPCHPISSQIFEQNRKTSKGTSGETRGDDALNNPEAKILVTLTL